MASSVMAATNKEYEDIFCHFPTFLDDSSSLTPVQDFLCNGGAFDVCNETAGFEAQKDLQLLPPSDPNNGYINGEMLNTECEAEPAKQKRGVVSRNSESISSKTLCRDEISKYFYMPITQAAKEMNIGLTLLKKTCRDLGIRRWPHRKLVSLQTLIKNVQELGNYEEKLKHSLCLLEEDMKLMVKIPVMKIEGKTKRLRQASFKANYKKRKLLMGSPQSANHQHNLEDEEDEERAFFSFDFVDDT